MASVVEQVFDCIKNKESFILDAGAGSGKTWTLVQALNYILETKSKELKNNGQKIVCITYTNIAKDEIIERTEHNELIHVGTIHDFLWECIKKFQSELKVKFLELMEEKLPFKKAFHAPEHGYRREDKKAFLNGEIHAALKNRYYPLFAIGSGITASAAV